jgi:hypothetical protein
MGVTLMNREDQLTAQGDFISERTGWPNMALLVVTTSAESRAGSDETTGHDRININRPIRTGPMAG